MEIEDYIEKIIDNGNVEDMHKLSEILEDVLEKMAEYDEECYKKYEMELYKMAYGEKLSYKMAEEIVNKMKPYGMRWSIEETQKMQRDYGLNNIRPEDFWIVLNSSYNDYRDLFNEDTEMYVRFANDFINDEDAKENKVFIYYTTIAE